MIMTGNKTPAQTRVIIYDSAVLPGKDTSMLTRIPQGFETNAQVLDDRYANLNEFWAIGCTVDAGDTVHIYRGAKPY